jgi:hypothetical protein
MIMGFRFRRYFSLLPGIRLNLGKKRVSVSVGRPGLTANISKDGIRKTVSLPGTGLSYSSYEKHAEKTDPEKDIRPAVIWTIIFSILAIAILVVVFLVALLKNK